MTDTKPGTPSRWGAVILIILVVTLLVSGGVALARFQPAPPLEITLPAANEHGGEIKIVGAVTNPGIYPFDPGDAIGSLLDAAGGALDASRELTLTVVAADSANQPQKININTAAAWLLEALPGIGETRAQTIVAYRQANGNFKHTTELMRVNGIGQSLYDEIKDLITVTD